MRVVNSHYKLFLFLTLIVLILEFHYAVPSPVDTSGILTTSQSVVLKNNLVVEKIDGSDLGVKKKKRKKRKRKRRRKGKRKKPRDKNKKDELGSIVADIASIFASFLSSVKDVPRNDEAIKVIEVIADSFKPNKDAPDIFGGAIAIGKEISGIAHESAPHIFRGAIEISNGISGIIKDVANTVENLGSGIVGKSPPDIFKDAIEAGAEITRLVKDVASDVEKLTGGLKKSFEEQT